MRTDKSSKTTKDKTEKELGDSCNSEKTRLEQELISEITKFNDDFVSSLDKFYHEKDYLKEISHKFVIYFAIFVAISVSLYFTNAIFTFSSLLIHSHYSSVIDFAILGLIEGMGGYAIYYAYKRSLISYSPSNTDPELKFYSKEVENARSATNKIFEGILTKIRDYIPGIDTIYNGIEKDRLIRDFATTLFNSLKRYRFNTSLEIATYLVHFNDPFKLEESWIDKASADISQKLGTEPIIVKLCYYDYKMDSTNLRNTWNEIIDNDKVFGTLLRHLIAKGLLESERTNVNSNEIKSLQQAIKNDQLSDISLELFRKYYQDVFKDFRKLKTDLIKLIEEYRFSNHEKIAKQIIDYMPNSVRDEKWKDEVLTYYAGILNISSEILKLLLAEYNNLFGDHESWRIIKHDSLSLTKILRLLIQNGLLDIPEKFTKDEKQIQKLTTLLSLQMGEASSFSLLDIGQRVTFSLTELSRVKKLFISSLKRSRIQIGDLEFESYDYWIPPSIEPKVISEYLENQLMINHLYSSLFYYSYVDDKKNSNLTVSEIIEGNLLNDFSSFLIERNVVPILKDVDKTLQIQSLAFIINKQREFVSDHLIKLHYWLNEVYRDYLKILEFVEVEFEKPLIRSEFSILADLFSEDADKSIELIQEKLLHYCIEQSLPSRPLPVTESDIEKSANALFQVHSEGRARQWACSRAWQSDLAINILYLYAKSFDEYDYGILDKPKRLIEIIQNYDPSLIKDEDKRSRFARELKDGKIPFGLNRLYSEDFESIDNNLNRTGMLPELNETLDDIVKFKEFLNIELPYDSYIDSLNMQLVSAYIITSKGQKDESVITQVVDKYLPTAFVAIKEQKQLTGYDKLLLKPLDDSLKTVMGKSVRVGVVPFRMKFEDFASLFRDAYEIAVDNYLTHNPKESEDVSTHKANLIRIFPSNRFFKQLGKIAISIDEIHKDDPINAIKSIMTDNFSRSQMLEIVATLKNRGEGQLAMHKMMVALLDDNVSLFQIIRRKLKERELYDKVRNSKLYDLFNNKSIDNKLQVVFDKSGLSTLSIYLYRTVTDIGSELRSEFVRDFEEKVKEITRGERIPHTQTVKEVADVILQRLIELGKLLIGIRGESIVPP